MSPPRISLAAVALLIASAPARAQNPATPAGAADVAPAASPPAPDLERRYQELLERQRQLEERLKVQESRPAPAPQTPLQLGIGNDGFFLGTRDSGFQLRLRGVIQADGRAYLDDPQHALTDTFLIRRARPIIEGTVGNFVDFRLLPDFGQGTLQLLDAFLNLRPWQWLRLRGGKFKTPFGLERLQQEQFLIFNERGQTSNLAPDRDIGLSLNGDVGDGLFEYDIGVFNGSPDGASNDGDTNDGKDFIARVFVQPFLRLKVRAIERMGVGFAATYGQQNGNLSNPWLPVFKTGGQETYFAFIFDGRTADGTAIASGIRYRFTPQLYHYIGPFGLLGEYIYSATTVVKGVNRKLLENQSWQIELSFVLTLESASYEGVRPRRPFDLRKRHFGAFELAGRYGELYVDGATFPTFADPAKSARTAKAWALQFNWYLTRNVRMGAQFERTTFEGGAPKGADRPTENALMGRMQVAF